MAGRRVIRAPSSDTVTRVDDESVALYLVGTLLRERLTHADSRHTSLLGTFPSDLRDPLGRLLREP